MFIRNRLRRLLNPAVWLTVGCLMVGINAGISGAIQQYHSYLTARYKVTDSDWGLFVSDVWNLSGGITSSVLFFYFLAVLASPEQRPSEKRILMQLAQRKLSGDFLTDDELSFWARVQREVEKDG